jgi:transposase InsO family protein
MFTTYVKLYPLKTATTKRCLNKLLNHYFIKINKPKVILSDHGSQFTSTKWKKTISDLGIEIKFSPIRNPESNPTERVMRELGKYFRIYCNETHKKWPELIPHIEIWMNSSLITSTKCTPVELTGKTNKLELFNVFRLPRTIPHEQKDLPTKLLEVYARLKGKSDKRKREKKERKFKRNFKVGDLVLVKCHHASEATQGIIGKFQPFEGPFTLSKQINPNMFELKD